GRQCNAVCFVEMHKKAAVEQGIRTEVAKDGGEAIFVLKHLAATSWERMLGESQCKAFRAATLHLQRGNLVVVTAHLFPGDTLGGANAERLRSVGHFVTTLADPWVIIGDWNLSTEQLQASQFMQLVDGIIVKPDVDITCSTASGSSLIDFAVAKRGFEAFLQLRACLQVPWKTHVGLELDIASGREQWWHQVLAVPRALPPLERPRRAPLEGSKRARRMLAQRRRRRGDLDPNLRAAFDDLAKGVEVASSQGPSEVEVAFHIPPEAWDLAACAVASQPRAPPRVGEAWAVPAGSGVGAVNDLYGRWVSALEETVLQVEGADDTTRRLLTPRKHNSDHQQRLTTVETIGRMMEQGESQPKDVIFGKRMCTADVKAWTAAVHSSTRAAAELEELGAVVERTRELVQRAFARSLAAAGQ
ncbi:unnamed protein product, partial [Prorocentrum cordatum]